MGKVYEAYVNASGVKTGGTASGTIFVLCIDPFLHMLQMQRGPRDIGRTFADDIGYVIFDLHLTLPRFAKCFRMFGKISNVKLKITKAIIVPLWTTDVEEAERVISKIVPEWSGVKISLCEVSWHPSWTPQCEFHLGRGIGQICRSSTSRENDESGFT